MTVRDLLAAAPPPPPASRNHPRLGLSPPNLHPPGHLASRAEAELGETPARRAAAVAALSTALRADATVSPTNATPSPETSLLLRALADDEPLLVAYARGAKFAPAPAVARLRALVAYVGRHPGVLTPPAAAIHAVCGADGGAAALTLPPSTDRWGHPLVVVSMAKLLRLADGGELDAAGSAPAHAGGGDGGSDSVSSRGGCGSDSGSSTCSVEGAVPVAGGGSRGSFNDGDVGGAGATRLLWVTLWCLLALLRQPRVSICGVAIVQDMGGVGIPRHRRLRRRHFAAAFRVLRDVLPCRLRGIYVLRQPPLVGMAWAVASRFVARKVATRRSVYGEPGRQGGAGKADPPRSPPRLGGRGLLDGLPPLDLAVELASLPVEQGGRLTGTSDHTVQLVLDGIAKTAWLHLQ